MDTDTGFRIILGILFVVMYLPRRYYQGRSQNAVREGLAVDLDHRWVILSETLLFTVSTVSILVYLIEPRWLAWSTLPLPLWLRWTGVFFGLLGTPLLIWTHVVLGKNFFGGMKIRHGHELVVAGPYRWIRHPMYTAFISLGICYFLATTSWLIGLPWLFATLIVLVTRLPQEEEMLLGQFGDEYRSYMARTGRLMPRLTTYLE